MDPSSQIRLATDIANNLDRLSPFVAWQGMPTYDQLNLCCHLVVQHLRPIVGYQYGVSSASQLTFKMNLLGSARGDVRQLIQNELVSGSAAEEALTFIRQWPGFEMPRLFSTLESIVNHVVAKSGSGPFANYGAYLSRCTSLFLPPKTAILDEFGMPPKLISKLLPRLMGASADVDALLENVRNLQVQGLGLDDTELELFEDLRATI